MPALVDLNPEFYRSEGDAQRGYLVFDCPLCPPDEHHRLQIPTYPTAVQGANGAKRWALSGQPAAWETVSLSPSIDLQDRCRWHGFVTRREVA